MVSYIGLLHCERSLHLKTHEQVAHQQNYHNLKFHPIMPIIKYTNFEKEVCENENITAT